MKVLRPAHFVEKSLEVLKSSALELISGIDGSVESIVEFAKRLAADKQDFSKVLWRQLVQTLGWGSGVVARYVKLGLAFIDIDVVKLSLIEPRTLFTITSSKKYRAVVDKIKSFTGLLTQQFVEYEMEQCRKQQAAAKQEEKPSIWRAQRGGGNRSCVIPPIYEKDSFVGTCVQEALEKGELPQTYIRKAVALVEAMESGAIEFKKELLPPQVAEILGLNIDEPTEVVQVVINENSEILTVKEVEVVEVVEIQHEIEAPSIPEVVTKLFACESYLEVQALMGALDTELKDQVWASLSSDEMQHFRDLKAGRLDVVTVEREVELPQDAVQVEEVAVEIQNQYQYKSLIDLLPTLESCVGLKVVVSKKVNNVRKSLSDVYQSVKGKVGEIMKKVDEELVFVKFDDGSKLTCVSWLEVIA